MSWPEAFAIVGTLAANAAIIWAFAWSQKNNDDDK